MLRIAICCAALLVCVTVLPPKANGQIYEWEYVDPSNPSLGKKQSTILVPDGHVANLNSAFGLFGHDLTKAYLPAVQIPNYIIRTTQLNDALLTGANMTSVTGENLQAQGADLSQAILRQANLEDSNLSGAKFVGANLTQARFDSSILLGADFTGANITDTRFNRTTTKGFTAQQLYQTASYANRQLGAISLSQNDLTNWDFTGQSMPRASFVATNLTNAIFEDSDISAADFSQSNLTPAQLYQTASYKNGVLNDLLLEGMDLQGWDFSDQSLVRARLASVRLSNVLFDDASMTNIFISSQQGIVHTDVSFRAANLSNATLSSNGQWLRADFTGANLEGAKLTSNSFVDSTFDGAIIRGAEMNYMMGSGFSISNLMSTASYQTGDLTNIEIRSGDLSGADFRGKDVSGTLFVGVDLDSTDFRGAKAVDSAFSGSLHGTDFRDADLTDASFSYSYSTNITFRGANLTGASFQNTSLVNADFTDAVVFGARLSVENSPQDLTAAQLYSTASYKSGSLGPVALAGNMQGWNFENQNLTGARFDRGSQLVGAQWDGATLNQATFFVNTLQDTDFRTTAMVGTQFISSTLDRSDFRGADLTGSYFSGSLIDARLQRSQLVNASFFGNLRGASFAEANLRGARFVSVSDFSGVDFTDADILGASFAYATNSGFTLNQLRSTKSFKERNLSGVDFEGMNLAGIDLSHFDLREADLNRANLTGADFSGSDLTGVSFQYADLENINLSDATIRRANFDQATREGLTRQMLESTFSFKNFELTGIKLGGNNLNGWDFRYQDLRGANLTGSTIQGTLFDLADLRAATPTNLSGAVFQRTILSNATIALLRILPGEVMSLRQAPQGTQIPAPANAKGIVVSNAAFQAGGTLKILLEDDWRSTLIFFRSSNALVDGTLQLLFDDAAVPANAVGKSFDLFDWPAIGPRGTFEIVTDPKHIWDLSNLYSTGVVTLLSVVPEPSSFVLLMLATSSAILSRRRTAC